jgi:hypothetical protein
MPISRREVLSGASAAALMLGMPKWAGAAIDGSSSSQMGRMVMNSNTVFANLAKGFTFAVDPANADANGYPISTPAKPIGTNPSFASNYYGDFVWKWSGQGSMQMGAALIIRSGFGHFVGGSGGRSGSGDQVGNITMVSQTSPRVVIAFGGIIQKISAGASNGAGGNYIRITTKSGAVDVMGLSSSSAPVKIQALSGHGQAAADGIWNVSKVDSSTFDLTTNTSTGLPSAYNAGDPYSGPGGEFICQGFNLSLYLLNQGRFSGFTNLVFCTAANESWVDSGKLVDPTYTAQLQYLKPAWLRHMDLSAVQASFENDFSRRVPASYINFQARRIVKDYWVGAITRRGAGDAYTCANPTASPSSGPYLDCEVVQGALDLPNTGMNPTLTLPGRGGTKFVYDFVIQPRNVRLSGAVPAKGSTISFTFTASWLNGSVPYVKNYTVGKGSRPDTTLDNIKANFADFLNADRTFTGKISFGNSGNMQIYPITAQAGELAVTASAPSGTFVEVFRIAPYNMAAETDQIRMLLGGTVRAGHNISITFTRPDLPGGAHTVNYTTLPSDTSLQVLAASLSNVIGNGNVGSGDATLQAAGIYANPFSLPPNTLNIVQRDTTAGGGLTMSFSSTGAEMASFAGTGATGTFIFSYLLDGWIWLADGFYQSVPFEYLVELCNTVGANCWYNWPVNTRGQFITDVTNFFKTNLRSDLKFGAEVGNEMWNFGQRPWGRALTLGLCLGFSPGSNNPNYSFTAARIKQYGDLSIAAWTSGSPARARSDLYLFNMSAVWDLASADHSQFTGANLDAVANPTYGSYGGLGGGSVSSYNVAPNRPIDINDALGIAPYWGSQWLSGDPMFLSGPVSENAPLLQASLDYANRNFPAAYKALYDQLYGTIRRSSGNAGGQSFTYYKTLTYPQLERICQSHDAGRTKKLSVIHYEGGPQFGWSLVNGTNDPTTDIPAVTGRLKALNWTSGAGVGAYTKSGANNATELATQLVGLIYFFKTDPLYKALYKQGYADVVAAHPTREAMGSQYGYTRCQWGLFPGDLFGMKYTSYDGIHEWNFGI